MADHDTPWRSLSEQMGYALGIALGYYALARLGVLLKLPPHGIPVLWPPNGVILGILLTSDKRRWSTILGATALCQIILNVTLPSQPLMGLSYVTANCIEIAMSAALIRRFSGEGARLRRMSEVVALLACALLACAVSGVIPALAASRVFHDASFLPAWGTWILGDGMGIVLLTPVILAWAPHAGAPKPKAPRMARALEAILLTALLLAVSEFIFGGSSAPGQERIPIMYLVFPFMLWAAVRFGPRGASAASLVVTLSAVINASLGHGPKFFGPGDVATRVYWIQIYLVVVLLSGLVLAAVWSERTDVTAALVRAENELKRTLGALEVRVEERTRELREVNESLGVEVGERSRAEEALRRAHDELEARVSARTLELVRANEALSAEIAERKRAEAVISEQAREILEMSTPIVKLWRGMELVPLIGTFDSRRAQQLMTRLLERVAAEGSSVVLLDVTGVPSIDMDTAQYLLNTISAVRLLGADAVLTGVRPSIARTLVGLGIDLASLKAQSSLSAGLHAMLHKEEVRGARSRS